MIFIKECSSPTALVLWMGNSVKYKYQLEVDLCFIISDTFSQFCSWFSRCKLLLYISRCWSNWTLSDCIVFKNSNTGRKPESNQLGIPGSRLLPNHDDGKCVLFVIVGNEAFSLSEHVLWHCIQQWMCIQRLTITCWMVDCSSGILAIKQKFFHGPLDVTLQCHDSIIKACCILHSFIHWKDEFQLEDTLYVWK